MNNINFRDCGDCNLCCKLPAIPNFKNSFEWCKNCNIGVGCSIYKNRPEPCKQFSCLWKAGLLAEDFKPNKVGFFITIDNELATVEKVLTVLLILFIKFDNTFPGPISIKYVESLFIMYSILSLHLTLEKHRIVIVCLLAL